jgi:hypothetical protein
MCVFPSEDFHSGTLEALVHQILVTKVSRQARPRAGEQSPSDMPTSAK